MKTPVDLVAEFYQAVEDGDTAGHRALLAQDFWFKGIMMSFDDRMRKSREIDRLKAEFQVLARQVLQITEGEVGSH